MLIVPGLVGATVALLRRPDDRRPSAHFPEMGRELGRALGRETFALAMLPYDAAIALGAIARTLFRLLVSHRHLLEWRTSSDAQRAARVGFLGVHLTLWPGPLMAIGLAVALATWQPTSLVWASPLLVLWALSPTLSWWLSRPTALPSARLSSEDVAFLRGVARRTWSFFETFVGADDHHLPPDNVQEDPPVGVAHRTSPTNIGLSLTANLAALDLGYLTVGGLIDRTSRTLATLDRLERHRGHFLNWYDTRTLLPLRPRYVSTVDSGNLAGHLLTLASGLDELAHRPLLGLEIFTGLADTLALLESAPWVGQIESVPRSLRARLAAELASVPRAPSRTEWKDALTRLSAGAAELVAVTSTASPLAPPISMPISSPLASPLAPPMTPSGAITTPTAFTWAVAFESACRDALVQLSVMDEVPGDAVLSLDQVAAR
ncbi:MAG: cyclic beta 1-2 glucan synthetase, partial [Deltaproteobacteria bacterium]|nr:cyclic beta 1-2 glucan synthetase [Deltaproteobacteria bacterium]